MWAAVGEMIRLHIRKNNQKTAVCENAGGGQLVDKV